MSIARQIQRRQLKKNKRCIKLFNSYSETDIAMLKVVIQVCGNTSAKHEITHAELIEKIINITNYELPTVQDFLYRYEKDTEKLCLLAI